MAPRIDSYEWERGREAMLRFGPAGGPVVVVAMPLLEEANRTRAFVVTILRALAARGIESVLPDLPATGESLVPTERMRLTDLRAAYVAAARATSAHCSVAVRSGALIDGGADLVGRWGLAPQTGRELVGEWRRVAGGDLSGEGADVAGNRLSRDFLDELSATALPGEGGRGSVRVVRLDSDPRDADLKVPGAPLWRRAEPGNDPALAQRLAADIADWIATCGG